MPSKRGVVVLVLACALVLAAAVGLNSRASDRFDYAPDEASARQLAREACDALEDFVALVNENGSARKAMALLERFERTASAAYDKDVRFTRLVSAAKALRAGFAADDANATRVGYDIGRAECGGERRNTKND